MSRSGLVLLLASLCGALPANHAAADYALLCTGELSGEGDAVRQGAGGVKFTNVNVAGASDLAQACATVRNDPLYGYYSWKTCVDPNGRGSCANASGPVSSGGPPAEQGIPPAQSTPLGPNQPPGIGGPPSPPIGPVSVEPSVNRPGLDYGVTPLPQPDPRQCASLCEADPRCAAYTYVQPGIQGPSAMCYLKSEVPSPVPDPCCVSGSR